MSVDPIADYNQINVELSLFDDALSTKPQIVVFTKMDLPDAQVNWELMEEEFYRLGVSDVIRISSVAHQNLQALQYRLLDA
jgi:GTP-binding protein